MQTPQPNDTVAAPASKDQDEQARREPGREAGTAPLAGEQVEERIVPRLATNHNETFLADL